MTKVRLTDLSVRQLPAVEKGQVRYFDASTPGFGITVGARAKTFFVVRGKSRQLTTIGRYPEISLQDARREAKRLLVQEPTQNASTRITEAVASYLKEAEARLRPTTVSEYRRYLSSLEDKPLKDFTKKDIDNTDAHLVMAVKVFFNWCVHNELVDRNPITHVPVSYNSRERVLTDEEIKAIWKYDYPPYSDIIKLCILTGQRRDEVAGFCEAWIDGDTITIPGTHTKNKTLHTFPFNLLTARYLSQYVGHTFGGWSKAKARLDKHIPLPHWTVHDLRRTFSTTHARIGTPLHVTERLLNHVSGTVSGVAATYNRYNYLKEMRTASLQYELFIANLVGARA